MDDLKIAREKKSLVDALNKARALGIPVSPGRESLIFAIHPLLMSSDLADLEKADALFAMGMGLFMQAGMPDEELIDMVKAAIPFFRTSMASVQKP